MPTLLADMHLDSIPKSLGGRFTQYNEPYAFDLSVGGPLVVPNTTTTATSTTTSTMNNTTNPSIIIDCGVGLPVDDTSYKGDDVVNYVENDHGIIGSSKKTDGNTIHNTASLSEDSEDIIRTTATTTQTQTTTTSTIASKNSNKISGSSDRNNGSSSSCSSYNHGNRSMEELNVRYDDVFNNNKFVLKKETASSTIEQQIKMIDQTMFIVKLLFIIIITIILFTICTNHLK